jgi:hypothetical protein
MFTFLLHIENGGIVDDAEAIELSSVCPCTPRGGNVMASAANVQAVPDVIHLIFVMGSLPWFGGWGTVQFNGKA